MNTNTKTNTKTIDILEIRHPEGGICSPLSSMTPASDKLRIQMENGYFIVLKSELQKLSLAEIKSQFQGIKMERDFGKIVKFFPVH